MRCMKMGYQNLLVSASLPGSLFRVAWLRLENSLSTSSSSADCLWEEEHLMDPENRCRRSLQCLASLTGGADGDGVIRKKWRLLEGVDTEWKTWTWGGQDGEEETAISCPISFRKFVSSWWFHGWRVELKEVSLTAGSGRRCLSQVIGWRGR